MAEEQGGGVVTVVRQDGDRVLVSVPMVGFPEGFQLTPGDRVAVVSEPGGAKARPLVWSRRVSSVDPQAIQAGSLEIEGRRVQSQAATLHEGAAPGDRETGAGERVVWVIEREDAERPGQVVASRSLYVRRQE